MLLRPGSGASTQLANACFQCAPPPCQSKKPNLREAPQASEQVLVMPNLTPLFRGKRDVDLHKSDVESLYDTQGWVLSIQTFSQKIQKQAAIAFMRHTF